MRYSSRRLKHHGYEGRAENRMAELIDINNDYKSISYKLRDSLAKNLNMQELKKLFGDEILKVNMLNFTRALEAGSLEDAKKYGDWLAQYCVSKPKEKETSTGKGADLLMEVVARALSEGMKANARLPEPDEDIIEVES